jgi:ankyrin repeat protein
MAFLHLRLLGDFGARSVLRDLRCLRLRAAPDGRRTRAGIVRLVCRRLLGSFVAIVLTVHAAAAETTLVQAVRSGDVAAVQSLLKQRPDVNAGDPDGTTPLHWAVRAGDASLVSLLLRAGADAKRANRYGVTPLHLAAVNGGAPLVKALVAAGADPKARLPEGETILMTAARTGSREALAVLLDAGADVDARDSWYGESALIWAAAEDHGEAVRLLVSRGADPNGRSAALAFERRRTGQSVLPLGSWTPLMYAARENAIDAGRALAASGASLDLTDPDGATALVVAIINAHYDFAAMLLDAGADPNVVDNDAGMGPLYAAVDMHRLAVGHGRPNPKPSGALGPLDIVTRLLETGADPNARLKAAIFQRHHTAGDAALGQGATPLMRAAKSGDVAMMERLMAAGADPTLTLPNGATALMLAAGLGWRDGSPLAPSYDQGSAEDAIEAIELLMSRGLSLDATTTTGDTALHAAVTGRGSPEIIRFLVGKGASALAENKRGQTPLSAALTSRKDLSAAVGILKEAANAAALR